ncbi:MAG: replicative DNA helicase [Synergistaceae bacterium]|nr:replicative DNA helicase [Synergistaceae bacterium]
MSAEKLPPFSLEAERAVLGACIVDREALGTAIEILKPDDFYESSSRILFETLINLYMSNTPADYVTLEAELKNKGMFDRLGGKSFITSLVAGVTVAANVKYHADIVRDCAIRRRIITASEKIQYLAYDYTKTPQEILGEAEKLLFDAGQNRNSGDFRHVSEIIGSVFVEIEDKLNNNNTHIAGYPTGFNDLDSFTGGLQPGSLNIIAARPSMGKTAFALNIAQFGGGTSNPPVLIFSLEMPSEHLVQRMIAAQSGVNLSRLANGTFDTTQFSRVREACDILARRNIYINDATQLTGMDFLARCRQFKTRHPDLALVIVDYLQLMTSGERRQEGRQQEVSDISRMLKVSAREMNCPVIALSQLSREAEKRTDKKPQLSDLRDSGAIEQDADVVMMLFREDYYSENENNDLKDSKADIRIAKNRNGSTGVFNLTFRREITRFLNFGED